MSLGEQDVPRLTALHLGQLGRFTINRLPQLERQARCRFELERGDEVEDWELLALLPPPCIH